MTESKENVYSTLVTRLERLSRWSSGLLDRIQVSEEVVLVATSLLVGIGVGVGAILFNFLIDLVRRISFEWIPTILNGLGDLSILLVPALGGLVAGPLIYRYAREAKGHGVPEVMEAIALRGGRIRPVVVVVKALASSFTIGTGGSVGREGPIVQIGAAFGSSLGQFLRFSEERIRNLVASGAAGGIAATFNAPIAGVIFAVEVIQGEISIGNISTVVISAVTASTVMQAVLGAEFVFPVESPYTIESIWEYGFYGVLGVMSALVAVLFVRTLYWSEDFFARQKRIVEWLQPAVGGLLLGALALAYPVIFPVLETDGVPQVFGGGYAPILAALSNHELLSAALLLLFLKMIATNLTLGSGGSGGIFAPSLFMGAMLGSAVGIVVNTLFPGIPGPPGAYALVGMAAVFAGAAHAPITAVIMLFELTGDYRIILPLMLTVIVTTLIARRLLNGESIYTLKLTRRGIRLQRGRDVDVMQGVTVGEAMRTPAPTIHRQASLIELRDALRRYHSRSLCVLDDNDRLFGIVTLTDLQRAYEASTHDEAIQIDSLHVGDICTRDVVTAHPDDVLWTAIRNMGARDIGRLPVVKPGTSELVGMVRRHDIMHAYNIAITRKLQDQHHAEQIRLNTLTGAHVLEVHVTTNAPVVNCRICDVKWPPESVIASIKRKNKLIVPHGNTQILSNDTLTVVADPEAEPELAALCGQPPS